MNDRAQDCSTAARFAAMDIVELREHINAYRMLLYRVAAADEGHKRDVGYPMLQPTLRHEIRSLFPNCTFPGADLS